MTEQGVQAAAAVLQGATPAQIIQLVLLGIISVIGIIAVVRYIIDLRVGKLPEKIESMQTSIASISLQIAKIESKLWSHEEIQAAIRAEINEHAANCPCRNKSNK